MTRNRLLIALGILAVAAAAWARVATTTVVFSDGNTPISTQEKHFAEKYSGIGTADTLYVWQGSFRGLTDDNTYLIITGLDTTLAYHLTAAIKIANQTGVIEYAINFPDGGADNADIDMCGATFCTEVLTACTGTTGTDVRFNTCVYNVGALGAIEFENRLNQTISVTWELIGGG